MLTNSNTEQLLTVKQAAELLQLDERTIRNHINGQRLPAQKLPGGKGWFIRREDLFTALQGASSLPPSAPIASSVVKAGTIPMQVESESGVIRRTHTAEGRARALAVLDKLQGGDEDGQHPESMGSQAPVEFRRWNVETWERLEDQE